MHVQLCSVRSIALSHNRHRRALHGRVNTPNSAAEDTEQERAMANIQANDSEKMKERKRTHKHSKKEQE